MIDLRRVQDLWRRGGAAVRRCAREPWPGLGHLPPEFPGTDRPGVIVRAVTGGCGWTGSRS
ncbi:hypothetical protein Sme01_49040 [Sphaerisporangium melleum]|uniref:Uncharacterized protein n=1 Tax=Sphaerisporangium melleum TaxID=321316 RepID=A0A917R421_9ACTN|nr:hypothetical protein [Sphaerisporangium melleum]GGK87617.1 hypothetical protein GCM10007964_32730 [Sphaerisporangium melleum]GII72428.1 hypothetical protein Sme01_49040 [Sphaerisporangium melleum]